MHVRRVGIDALLLEFARAGDTETWRADLWRRRERGEFSAREIVAGARTVLLDGCADAGMLAGTLPAWSPSSTATSTTAEAVTIPMRYDGEDLDWVAGRLGCSPEAFVRRHLDTEFHAAFCGFAPGFAYMTGLDVFVPRLDTPRPNVPAGSVALADTYCGIYPTASPGGWRLIGRTDAVLFDPERATPALLAPGVRVRFERVES